MVAPAQDVELLRRQLEELSAQMDDMRQESTNAAMNAAVTALTEAVRTKVQSSSKPRPDDMKVWKPAPYVLDEDFDGSDLTFNGNVGALVFVYRNLRKAAINDTGDGVSTTGAAVHNAAVPSLRCSHKKEHGRSRGRSETTASRLTDNCAWRKEFPITRAALDYACRS